MENLGIATALVTVGTDDGRRYEGTLMLSALPNAPTVEYRPRLAERLRRLVPTLSRPRGRQPLASATGCQGCGVVLPS